MTTAILVTTFNRPSALERSLPQIARLGAPVLVVDDGSVTRWTRELEKCAIADYLYVPRNRGLAAAMNIGLSYWLADKDVRWISYFQDDVDVHPKMLEILSRFQKYSQVLTGHDAGEHRAHKESVVDGVSIKDKWAIRATHVHASASFWRDMMPIPTRELGAPKRQGLGRGLGSDVDWWFVRDSPKSSQKTNRPVLCVPGLVRSFLYKAEDSCWNNPQKAGEEPPLKEW